MASIGEPERIVEVPDRRLTPLVAPIPEPAQEPDLPAVPAPQPEPAPADS